MSPCLNWVSETLAAWVSPPASNSFSDTNSTLNECPCYMAHVAWIMSAQFSRKWFLDYLLHQVWLSSPLTLFRYLWRALLAKLLHKPCEADGSPEHSPSAMSHHWSMIPGFVFTISLYASAKFLKIWNTEYVLTEKFSARITKRGRQMRFYRPEIDINLPNSRCSPFVDLVLEHWWVREERN